MRIEKCKKKIARIETKMLISPFAILRRFEIFALSYVVSIKVFGKTEALTKISEKSVLQVMTKTKIIAKMVPNVNFSVFKFPFLITHTGAKVIIFLVFQIANFFEKFPLFS